jgi:hypothetical protein
LPNEVPTNDRDDALATTADELRQRRFLQARVEDHATVLGILIGRYDDDVLACVRTTTGGID